MKSDEPKDSREKYKQRFLAEATRRLGCRIESLDDVALIPHSLAVAMFSELIFNMQAEIEQLQKEKRLGDD